MSNSTSPASQDFVLQSAVVNDYILVDNLPLANSTSSFTGKLTDMDLGAEIVSYVVISQGAMPISGASATPPLFYYTLSGTVTSSASVQVSPSNLLLYRAFKSIVPLKQTKVLDFNYSGPVDENVLPPPLSSADLPVFANNLELADGVVNGSTNVESPLQLVPDSSFEESKIEPDFGVLTFEKRGRGAVRRQLQTLRMLCPDVFDEVVSAPLQSWGALISGAVTAFDLITRYGPDVIAKSKAFYNSYKRNREGSGRLVSAIQAMKDTFENEIEELTQPKPTPRKQGKKK